MRLRLLACLLLLLAPIHSPAAGDLDTLLEQGRLTIDSYLEDSGTLVPGQRARMVIEVATSTWFSGGTRIRLPEVPGLVILQTEQFAANASETRQGTTWVLQRWSVDLFPQRAGDFEVPAMTLRLKVNGGELGDIEGETTSPPLTLRVSLPPALEQADFWVASPDYRVTQTISRDTATLAPGDAFERRISFRAEDVPAMMLPEMSGERQDGLASYPAPPVLENRTNRGQSVGSREQIVSYVAEHPGNYLLPAKDFFWWDTREEKLKVLNVPAIEVRVAGEPLDTGEAAWAPPWRYLFAAVLVMIIVAAMTLLLRRYRPWRWWLFLLEPLRSTWQRLLELRQPALPRRLNPDNSAGD